MLVVTPCRSDRSTLGLLPYCHLNDGRLHLILIKDCSRPQYLKFLASIPLRGNSFQLVLDSSSSNSTGQYLHFANELRDLHSQCGAGGRVSISCISSNAFMFMFAISYSLSFISFLPKFLWYSPLCKLFV